MKFMLLMTAPKGTGDWAITHWKTEDFKAHIQFMRRFGQELGEGGELVSQAGLAAPAQARVVRAGFGGTPEVTDGPFAESKEFLAGFWIIDVENAARAYALAAKASAAPGPGGVPLNFPIEVREVQDCAPIEV